MNLKEAKKEVDRLNKEYYKLVEKDYNILDKILRYLLIGKPKIFRLDKSVYEKEYLLKNIKIDHVESTNKRRM